VIKSNILTLAQASLDMEYFPTAYKTTTTIVLRKPSKPDYTKPGAYRPIALENTMGKVIESVIAEILSYLAETYQLLPPEHFGGRPGRTTEDAMLMLTENIHRAWKGGDVYSTVFMDVAGAFNNVHHQRLLHNLRAKRIPKAIAAWVESFLKGRTTRLRFNGTESASIRTVAGIPQGSPLSPILYMFYNGDLLKIPPMVSEKGHGIGFIDDIAYGVQGSTAEENAQALQTTLERAEEWRIAHGAKFETSKYVLVHFTRSTRTPTEAAVMVQGHVISPSNETRYLGVVFDKQLRYTPHRQYIAKKGTAAAMALARIASSTWGALYQRVRQLYIATVIPRMDYAAII